ncbi:MAG: hypothetical protein ABW217_03810 [Polyangiaceae bacterium]
MFWSNYLLLAGMALGCTDWAARGWGWHTLVTLLVQQVIALCWAFMVAFSDTEDATAATVDATPKAYVREHWLSDRHGRKRLMTVETVGQLPEVVPTSFAPEQLVDDVPPKLMDPDIGHMPPT